MYIQRILVKRYSDLTNNPGSIAVRLFGGRFNYVAAEGYSTLVVSVFLAGAFSNKADSEVKFF